MVLLQVFYQAALQLLYGITYHLQEAGQYMQQQAFIIVASLCTKAPGQDIVDEFERAKKEAD